MLEKICSNEVSHKNTKFYCKRCDYSCEKMFLFKQHCLTKKHNRSQCSNGSKKYAKAAIRNKVDYVAFGSFFQSKLKPRAKKANLKVLKWAKKNIKKPIVVIGGITDKNYKKLIKAGANYIAISTFIWNNPFLKPEVAIKKFK